MLLTAVGSLPAGADWIYELKLDGYRAIAFKSRGQVHLRSRNDNDFAGKYKAVAHALEDLPDETVIDGEVVAFDPRGRPSFNRLQNCAKSDQPIFFYAFDLLMLKGRDTRAGELEARRYLLIEKVLPQLGEPIRLSPALDGDLPDLIKAVNEQKLEGLVAKRKKSVYKSGERSDLWLKMRINSGQEFVIGGYTLGGTTFDALIFGYYEEKALLYAARTRNGFTPAIRQSLMGKFRGLETDKCPFANLPEKHGGRWGQGLTVAKMKDCVWLKPQLVGQFEFVEWTPDNHLRHSKFIGLRGDKKADQVGRETE
jgi:bifunctional non-homologous end joining protein LigD